MTNPESLSIDDVKYVRADLARNSNEYNENYDCIIGNQYVIETPTKYWVGTLAKETETHYIFVNAAWIVSTGNFSDYCDGAKPNYMEPMKKGSHIRISKGAECVMYPHEIKIQLVGR